jgi:DNA segregation ATPase FtsK/SpoIIIE-like protein
MLLGVDVKDTIHTITLNARSIESMIGGGIPGNGKSSEVLCFLGSVAACYTPEQVQFLIWDGKHGVEFSWLNGSPYLARPVACYRDDSLDLMEWLQQEIKTRNKIFTKHDVSNLEDYLQLPNVKRIPYLVGIVDETQELFDFNPIKGKNQPPDLDLGSSNTSLGRSAGCPLYWFTQRPDRRAIPGQIDGKCGSRMAFLLQRDTDSELVLSGEKGAEKLMPKGDMLFKHAAGKPISLQGLKTERSDVEPHLFPDRAKPTAPVDDRLQRIHALRNQGIEADQIICQIWHVDLYSELWKEAAKEYLRLMSGVSS